MIDFLILLVIICLIPFAIMVIGMLATFILGIIGACFIRTNDEDIQP